MNALQTGIDAQSQIITGEDPETLERLTARYYDRFQPQGPEEAALIDDAISSEWLLLRLRKTEAEIWNRSTTETAADNRKWGRKAEAFPLAAAFRDEQKVFERLQRRISAAERSLRAALETLARLRKQGRTGLLACQGQASWPVRFLRWARRFRLAMPPASPTLPPTLPQLLQTKLQTPKLALLLQILLNPPPTGLCPPIRPCPIDYDPIRLESSMI